MPRPLIALTWTASPSAEQAAHRVGAHVLGRHPGPLLHRCPTCGSLTHGVPSFEDVAISITRTAGATVVAASTAGAVGVDVEAPSASSGPEPDWTRREAVGKAYGVGITGEPGDEALVREVQLPGLVLPVVVALLAPAWPRIDLLSPAGPGVPDGPATR